MGRHGGHPSWLNLAAALSGISFNSSLPGGFAGLRERELLDDRGEVNGLRVLAPVLGNFLFLDDPEPESLENLGSTTGLESDELSENLPFPVRAQVVEIGIQHHGRPGDALGLRKHVKMKVGGATGGCRNFFPGVFQDPVDELSSGFVVLGIPPHPNQKEPDIVEKAVPLLAERPSGSEQVPFHDPMVLKDKR